MRNTISVILLLAGLSVAAVAQPAIDKKQAAKDWAELAELATQYRGEFQAESDFTKKGAAFPAPPPTTSGGLSKASWRRRASVRTPATSFLCWAI